MLVPNKIYDSYLVLTCVVLHSNLSYYYIYTCCMRRTTTTRTGNDDVLSDEQIVLVRVRSQKDILYNRARRLQLALYTRVLSQEGTKKLKFTKKI